MTRRSVLSRATATIAVLLAAFLFYGCSDLTSGPSAYEPQFFSGPPPDISAAIQAQERHSPELLRRNGVVGTAVGLTVDGRAIVRVFLSAPGVANIPVTLDNIPVQLEVTGLIMASSDPRLRARPAPVGFSVGHPAITAGTIGARVIDASGRVFVLSNNHVLANMNNASIGDATLQPGTFDGGRDPADRIGTLFAFQPMDFNWFFGATNTMDAAIALTTTTEVDFATPTDDGYGAPGTTIYGDANGDGLFDSKAALLNVQVHKYGRTTKHTFGRITGVNASLTVCYDQTCIRRAAFVDQLVIDPGSFSGGGDSGSLIVATDAANSPIGLLFAGSTQNTFANRVDLVLQRFGVRIDGSATEPPPPPDPVTDVAVLSVNAPASATRGDPVNVSVTVRNVGNQPVGAGIVVTLTDQTDGQVIGTTTITSGLAAGASATVPFSWNTANASEGAHTLHAAHSFADDIAANDAATTTVQVTVPSTTPVGLHGGDIDATTSRQGGRWTAIVTITIHGANHELLAGAQVGGIWDDALEWTCTTNATGQCTVTRTFQNKVNAATLIKAAIVHGLTPFTPEHNHDPDGDSDGTMITVRKPS